MSKEAKRLVVLNEKNCCHLLRPSSHDYHPSVLNAVGQIAMQIYDEDGFCKRKLKLNECLSLFIMHIDCE